MIYAISSLIPISVAFTIWYLQLSKGKLLFFSPKIFIVSAVVTFLLCLSGYLPYFYYIKRNDKIPKHIKRIISIFLGFTSPFIFFYFLAGIDKPIKGTIAIVIFSFLVSFAMYNIYNKKLSN